MLCAGFHGDHLVNMSSTAYQLEQTPALWNFTSSGRAFQHCSWLAAS